MVWYDMRYFLILPYCDGNISYSIHFLHYHTRNHAVILNIVMAVITYGLITAMAIFSITECL